MSGKERGDKSAAPGRAGHRLQDKKEEKNRDGVQEDIYKVVTARVEAKELGIQHEGDRRERMPVADQRLSKGGHQARTSQAVPDGGVIIDIEIVIVVKEIETEGAAEYDPRDRDQAQTNRRSDPPLLLIR